MKTNHIHIPQNVRKLAVIVRRLGGSVGPKHRTGEWKWIDPNTGRSVVTPAARRRKDPTKKLLAFVRHVVREQGLTPVG